MRYKLLVAGILCMLAFNAKAIAQHTGHDHNATTEQTHTKHEHNPAVTTQYTCPMHPDVKADKPGKCPKCGMNLEKVEPKTEKK